MINFQGFDLMSEQFYVKQINKLENRIKKLEREKKLLEKE